MTAMLMASSAVVAVAVAAVAFNLSGPVRVRTSISDPTER